MRAVTADEARAFIAAHVLGQLTDCRLGDIELHAHQADAVGRLRRVLEEHGGALLADDVGLGKTFVALALAANRASVLVIAPAAVRAHWTESARRARVVIAFHSMESLSQRGAPDVDADFVIVDEAHHFRARQTRRFAAATRLCARARVLLLSATPIQNREDDLRTVLSLFLGARADALTSRDLPRFIVRRTAADLEAGRVQLPAVAAPQWLPPIDDVDCLDRILVLPAPVPPVDSVEGGALVTFTLVKQWASSRAALVSALRRRIGRGLAMIDALRAGRIPTRDELAAWCLAGDSQQLVFPELVAVHAGSAAETLRAQVEAHVQGVRALVGWLATAADPDVDRARALTTLMDRHPGERIIAFSEYADTVAALFRLVAPSARVAMLTHARGRMVSGPIDRAEILDRFAAGAGARAHARERIDLLLTTDVLSEGVSLPDASVVVHLDLAWNPARMEQRVGRLRRVDSKHRRIAVYVVPPPVSAERMLRLEARLRSKRAVALNTLGVAGAVLPGGESLRNSAAVQAAERLASIMQSWRRSECIPEERAVMAAVRAGSSAAIVCVRVAGVAKLLGVVEGRVVDDAAMLQGLCAAAGGESARVDPRLVEETCQRIERYLVIRGVHGAVERGAMVVARARRAVLHRADSIARRASREARPRLAALLRGVRAAAGATLSAGAERILDDLARAQMPDEDWLGAINEFASTHARPASHPGPAILAVLILVSG